MNAVRVALFAVLLGTTAAVFGAEPTTRPRWRAVTASERPHSGVGPLATEWVAPAPASDAPPAQIVFIDPVTNAILPLPPVDPGQHSTAALRPPVAGPEVQLQMTARGHLYIDLSSYRETATATLGDHGEIHLRCSGTTHEHLAPAATEPAQ